MVLWTQVMRSEKRAVGYLHRGDLLVKQQQQKKKKARERTEKEKKNIRYVLAWNTI